MAFGREKLSWNQDIWNRIDRAVYDECASIRQARKFLPPYGPVSDSTLTVPSHTISFRDSVLYIDEAATERLIELSAEFSLTRQQVEREQEDGAAVALATRAANLLSQAEDIVIFQGQVAIMGDPTARPPIPPHPLFASNKVTARSGPAGIGLLNAPEKNPAGAGPQVVTVDLIDPPDKYGENSFAAVAQAYSRLQAGIDLAQSHYGPYALVLRTEPYADTHAPLKTTLIMPADRIISLVTSYGTGTPQEKKEHFYNTGTLPERRGILVSFGGNTMDLVVSVDAKTAFLQEDQQGLYRFRVFERFALRLKDPSAVMRLEFEAPKAAAAPPPAGGGKGKVGP